MVTFCIVLFHVTDKQISFHDVYVFFIILPNIIIKQLIYEDDTIESTL
jgi:hypothetical protein